MRVRCSICGKEFEHETDIVFVCLACQEQEAGF